MLSSQEELRSHSAELHPLSYVGEVPPSSSLQNEIAEMIDPLGESLPLRSQTADSIETYINNPSQIPLELVGAALQRLLDADANKLQEELSKITKIIGGGSQVQKYLLEIFVRTWSEENGFRIVEDKNITPHIQAARALLKQQNSQGKIPRIIAILRGQDQVTYTELILMAEELAKGNQELEDKNAQLRIENMALSKDRATIVSEAHQAADIILGNAQAESYKAINQAVEERRSILKESKDMIKEARREAQQMLSEARTEAAEIIAKARQEGEVLLNAAVTAVTKQSEELRRLEAAKSFILDQHPAAEDALKNRWLSTQDSVVVMNQKILQQSSIILGALRLSSFNLFTNALIDFIEVVSQIDAEMGSAARRNFVLSVYQYLLQDKEQSGRISTSGLSGTSGSISTTPSILNFSCLPLATGRIHSSYKHDITSSVAPFFAALAESKLSAAVVPRCRVALEEHVNQPPNSKGFGASYFSVLQDCIETK